MVYSGDFPWLVWLGVVLKIICLWPDYQGPSASWKETEPYPIGHGKLLVQMHHKLRIDMIKCTFKKDNSSDGVEEGSGGQ